MIEEFIKVFELYQKNHEKKAEDEDENLYRVYERLFNVYESFIFNKISLFVQKAFLKAISSFKVKLDKLLLYLSQKITLAKNEW